MNISHPLSQWNLNLLLKFLMEFYVFFFLQIYLTMSFFYTRDLVKNVNLSSLPVKRNGARTGLQWLTANQHSNPPFCQQRPLPTLQQFSLDEIKSGPKLLSHFKLILHSDICHNTERSQPLLTLLTDILNRLFNVNEITCLRWANYVGNL